MNIFFSLILIQVLNFYFGNTNKWWNKKTCDDDISTQVNIRRERLVQRSNAIKTFDSKNMFNCIVSLESAKSLAKNKKKLHQWKWWDKVIHPYQTPSHFGMVLEATSGRIL